MNEHHLIESLESRRLLSGDPASLVAEFLIDTVPHQLVVSYAGQIGYELQLTNVTFDKPMAHYFEAVSSSFDDGRTTVVYSMLDQAVDLPGANLPGALPDGNYDLYLNYADPNQTPDDQPAGFHNKDLYFLMGDANRDRTVDAIDVGIVFDSLDGVTSNPHGWSDGDFNGDGVIDFGDLDLIDTTNRLATVDELLASPELLTSFAQNTSVTLTWVDNLTSELGWRVMRSVDGINWTDAQNLNADATSYTFQHLPDGTQQFLRVRSYGPDSAYRHVTAVTSLVKPTNVRVTDRRTNGLTIEWDSASVAPAIGYVISARPAGGTGGTGGTGGGEGAFVEVGNATVGDTSAVLTGLDENTDYEFRIEAYSDYGLSTPPTEPIVGATASSQVEPTSPWSQAYQLIFYAGPEWSKREFGPVDTLAQGYKNEAVTLNVTNLKRHTWTRVALGVFTYKNSPGSLGSSDGASFTAMINNVSYSLVDNGPLGEGREWLLVYPDGDTAFKHKGGSIAATIRATGLHEDWRWGVGGAQVDTYLPMVSLIGDGTVVEDNTGSASFTAGRTEAANATINSEPLTVFLQDAHGTATADIDFERIKKITIPAGNVKESTKVKAIDDPEGEGVETILTRIAPSAEYFAPPVTTQPAVAAVDDNVSVKSISVSVLKGNEAGILQPPPRVNRPDGFDFGVRIDVIGEKLSQAVMQQEIYAETDVRNPNNGVPLTPAEVLGQRWPLNTDPNTVHGLFQWHVDTKWTYAVLPAVSANGETGYADDRQHLSLGSMQVGEKLVAPLWTVARFYKITIVEGAAANPGKQLGQHEWGYHWSNSNLPRGEDKFANVVFAPLASKGSFYDTFGVSGLGDL